MTKKLNVALVYAVALDQLVSTALSPEERAQETDDGAAVPMLYATDMNVLFVPLAVLTLPFSRADPLEGEDLNERLGDLPEELATNTYQIRLGENLLVDTAHLLSVFRLWESRLGFAPIYSADALEAVLSEVATQASLAASSTLGVGNGEISPITVH
jgi:hypothetical protein